MAIALRKSVDEGIAIAPKVSGLLDVTAFISQQKVWVLPSQQSLLRAEEVVHINKGKKTHEKEND